MAAGELKPEEVPTALREAVRQYKWILANGKTPPVLLSSVNLNRYVEDFDEPRTKPGKRRVSARRGWAGEKGGFFSSLLRGEELFGVGRREPTELSAVAGAIQDRNL